ncbi:MAG: acetate kinase, partial [Nanoarchaeota archaeon]|nr:acetate kinase [Nanoarchaeota archaeon]
EYIGLRIDKTRNKNNKTIISADNSKIKALVIPTNEELQIARETFELVK